ncbi:hypothetical protein O5541_02765 [Escherichia coli]|nr:hypothetical protein [Escherichia coli]
MTMLEQAMNDFAAATGRQYQPFEYYGHPQAERVIILMGSAIGTCEEVVDELLTRGEKVGVLKVRLYSSLLRQTLAASSADPYAAWRYWTEPKNPGAPGRTALSGCDDRTGRSFNNMASAKPCPRVIAGAMVFHPKNLARTVYWRYLPSSTRLNRKRALRLVFTMM